MYGININKDKCVRCNKCISVCPTNLANICKNSADNTSYIEVDHTKCINCGECIKACSVHKARYFEDDIDSLFDSIKSNKDLILIVAPSIRVAFPDNWKNVITWLRKQGIKSIYDVSFGADLCTWAHIEFMKKNRNKKIITQPCAAITDYITKYQPELIPSLSPVKSPMLCLASYIKYYEKKENRIAALSPCIAKKNEFTESGLVDYNITFLKLKEYIQNNNINLNNYIPENDKLFDSYESYDGVLYPTPGGLKENILRYIPDLKIINCEGHEKIYDALRLYSKTPAQNLPDVFDVLGCEYGCNSGPGIGCEPDIFAYSVQADSERDSLRTKRNEHKKAKTSKQFKNFTKKLKLEDFLTEYKAKDITIKEPSEKEYEEVFAKLYKDTDAKKNFNCGACGYKTCRQMARAVILGYTTLDNCFEKAKIDINLQKNRINDMNDNISNIVIKLNSVVSKLVTNINSVTQNITNMNELNDKNSDQMNNINSSIQGLSKISERINDSIKIINDYSENNKKMSNNLLDIAQQTNILSINASIEAARSDKNSGGFSVISNEIGMLANKSKTTVESSNQLNINMLNATDTIISLIKNIETTLTDIMKTVSDTSGSIDETKTESNNILLSIREISGIANEVEDMAVKTTQVIKTYV